MEHRVKTKSGGRFGENYMQRFDCGVLVGSVRLINSVSVTRSAGAPAAPALARRVRRVLIIVIWDLTYGLRGTGCGEWA